MKLRTTVKLAREGMTNLRARSGMGVTAMTIITLAFIIVGFFLQIYLNLDNLGQSLAQRLQLRVFITEGAPLLQLEGALRRLPGVSGLDVITKEEALQSLKKQLGERAQLLELVDQNPLPHTFVLQVERAELIPEVAAAAADLDGVEEVVYGRESLGKLLSLVEAISWLSLAGSIVIFSATLFIVVNTIRLTVIARKQEIAIRRLVGATNAFIRAPFLFEGLYMGLTAAAIASLLGDLVYRLVMQEAPQVLPFLPLLPRDIVSPLVTVALFLMGIFLGLFGSSISVRRYLR